MTEMTVRAQKAAGGMLALTASAHFLNDMIQSVIPACVNLIERIAGFDFGAFLKLALFNDARDLGADLGDAVGAGAARQFRTQCCGSKLHLSHFNLRRRRLHLLRRLFVAAAGKRNRNANRCRSGSQRAKFERH